MSDIYAERGYGALPLGFGAKPGVVVVDFQRAFTDPRFPMGGAPMVDRAVDNTVWVMRAARRAGLPVIACVNAYDTPRAAPHWKISSVPGIRIGSPEAELDPRIAAEEPGVVLVKAFPSIFFSTPAAAILTRERVDSVIITGCTTSGCVRASINDCFSLGFRTLVAEDCVGDHDQAAHDANLHDVERRYADIIDSATAIAAIERWQRSNAPP